MDQFVTKRDRAEFNEVSDMQRRNLVDAKILESGSPTFSPSLTKMPVKNRKSLNKNKIST